MDTITIHRTAQQPLVFCGELLGEGDGTPARDETHRNRWWVVRTYATKSGLYVASVEFRTRWHTERNECWAQVFPDPHSLSKVLLSRQPLPDKLGRPDDAAFQAKLVQALTSEYRSCCAKALDVPVFAELVK